MPQHHDNLGFEGEPARSIVLHFLGNARKALLSVETPYLHCAYPDGDIPGQDAPKGAAGAEGGEAAPEGGEAAPEGGEAAPEGGEAAPEAAKAAPAAAKAAP